MCTRGKFFFRGILHILLREDDWEDEDIIGDDRDDNDSVRDSYKDENISEDGWGRIWRRLEGDHDDDGDTYWAVTTDNYDDDDDAKDWKR